MYYAIDMEDFPKIESKGDKKKIEKKTYTFILLNLSNKVLGEEKFLERLPLRKYSLNLTLFIFKSHYLVKFI